MKDDALSIPRLARLLTLLLACFVSGSHATKAWDPASPLHEDEARAVLERYGEAIERRTDIRRLIERSKEVQVPTGTIDAGASTPGEPVREIVFRAFGPEMDEDLTTFYTVLASEFPQALNPIRPEDRPDTMCAGRAACDPNEELVLHRYKLLGRQYPSGFTEKVLEPLRKWTGDESELEIPGLETQTFELLTRISTAEAGHDPQGRVICRQYRLDEHDDCILGSGEQSEVRTFYRVKAQGLSVAAHVTESALLTINARLKQLTDAGDLSRAEYFVNGQARGTARFGPIGAVMTADFVGAAGQIGGALDPPLIEFSERLDPCDQGGASRVPPSIGDLASIEDHVVTYTLAVRAGRGGGPVGVYPTILVVDKLGWLGEDDNRSAFYFPLSEAISPVGHPEFLTAADVRRSTAARYGFGTAIRPSGCWLPQIPEDGDSNHGLMIAGLLAAPSNDVGIVGLIPLAAAQSMIIIPAEDLDGTKQRIFRWLAEFAYDGMPVIVSMSLDFPGASSGGSSWESVRRQLDEFPNVLWIVAAGNVKTADEADLLKSNCEHFPACLGDHPNVVTVAALDYDADKPTPTLAGFTRHGASMVSVAAPGVEILVPRVGRRFGEAAYTLADGSSFAAAFVTAVAGRIWGNGRFSALDVKARLIAASAKLLTKRKVEQILAGHGDHDGVLGGALSAAYGDYDPAMPDLVVFANGERKLGKVAPNPKHRSLAVCVRPRRGPCRTESCAFTTLLRVRHSFEGESEKLTLVCQRYDIDLRYPLSVVKGDIRYFDRDKQQENITMECIETGDCLYFCEGDLVCDTAQAKPIDFLDIQDIHLR